MNTTARTLWTIAAVIVGLWLIGAVINVVGSVIHLLLLVALFVIVLALLRRNPA